MGTTAGEAAVTPTGRSEALVGRRVAESTGITRRVLIDQMCVLNTIRSRNRKKEEKTEIHRSISRLGFKGLSQLGFVDQAKEGDGTTHFCL